jgi:hypothetical protein
MVRIRIRIRIRNFSEVGSGSGINSFGSTTLLIGHQHCWQCYSYSSYWRSLALQVPPLRSVFMRRVQRHTNRIIFRWKNAPMLMALCCFQHFTYCSGTQLLFSQYYTSTDRKWKYVKFQIKGYFNIIGKNNVQGHRPRLISFVIFDFWSALSFLRTLPGSDYL